MFTFLPPEYKKVALKEYRFRLTLVYLSLMCVFFVLASVGNIPTFALIYTQKSNAVMEQAALVQNLKEDPSVLQKELSLIKEKVSFIQKTLGETALTNILERVLKEKSPDIHITSLVLKRGDPSGTIIIGATASSRDSLVAFSKRLQGEPSFTRVNLPVGSLAKSKDISFSISIDSVF